jgi:hypothetical protein
VDFRQGTRRSTHYAIESLRSQALQKLVAADFSAQTRFGSLRCDVSVPSAGFPTAVWRREEIFLLVGVMHRCGCELAICAWNRGGLRRVPGCRFRDPNISPISKIGLTCCRYAPRHPAPTLVASPENKETAPSSSCLLIRARPSHMTSRIVKSRLAVTKKYVSLLPCDQCTSRVSRG